MQFFQDMISALAAAAGLGAAGIKQYPLPEGFSGELTIDRDQLINCAHGVRSPISEAFVSTMPPIFDVSRDSESCDEAEAVIFSDTCGIEGRLCTPRGENETGGNANGPAAQGWPKSSKDCQRACAKECATSILVPGVYGTCVNICIDTVCQPINSDSSTSSEEENKEETEEENEEENEEA